MADLITDPALKAYLTGTVNTHLRRNSWILDELKKMDAQMDKNQVERRVRMLSVRSAQILELLNLGIRKGDERSISIVFQYEGIPEGAEALSAYYDLARDAWQILIRHPSFDVVPGAMRPPEVARFTQVQIKRFGPSPVRDYFCRVIEEAPQPAEDLEFVKVRNTMPTKIGTPFGLMGVDLGEENPRNDKIDALAAAITTFTPIVSQPEEYKPWLDDEVMQRSLDLYHADRKAEEKPAEESKSWRDKSPLL